MASASQAHGLQDLDGEGSPEIAAQPSAGGYVRDSALSQRPPAGDESIAMPADSSGKISKSQKIAVRRDQDQETETQPASFFFRATSFLQSTALNRASLFVCGSQQRPEPPQFDTETGANPSGQRQRDKDPPIAINIPHPQTGKFLSNSQLPVSAWPSSVALWNWVVGAGTNLKGNRPARGDDEDNPVTISLPPGSHNYSVVSATLRTPENTPIQLPAFVPEVARDLTSQDENSSTPFKDSEPSHSSVGSSTSGMHLQTERKIGGKSFPSLQLLYSADALVSHGSLSPYRNIQGLLKIEDSITSVDMLSFFRDCIRAKTMSLSDDDMPRTLLKTLKFDISRPSGAFVRSFGLLMFIHTQINFYGLDTLPDLQPALNNCIWNLRKVDDVIDGCNVTLPKHVLAGYLNYLCDKLVFISNSKNVFEGNFAVARHVRRLELEHVELERAHQHQEARGILLLPQTVDDMLMLLNSIENLLTALTGSYEVDPEIMPVSGCSLAGERSGRISSGCPEVHERTEAEQPLESMTSKNSSIEIGLREETKDTLAFYMLAEATYLSQAILCLASTHEMKADVQSSEFETVFNRGFAKKARALAARQSSLIRTSWAEHAEIGEIRFDMSRLLGDHNILSIKFPMVAKSGSRESDSDVLKTYMPTSYANTVECAFSNFVNLHISMGEAIASASM